MAELLIPNENRAEPVATANGPAGPWLISNVGQNMRAVSYVVSGVVFVVCLPFAGMMIAFAHDAPNPSLLDQVFRWALVITFLAIPLVWLGGLVLSLIVARRKSDATIPEDADLLAAFTVQKARLRKRERFLKFCALSPYFAAAIHLSVWIIAFTLSR